MNFIMEELFEVIEICYKKVDDKWCYIVSGRALNDINVGDLVHFRQDCIYEIKSMMTYGRETDILSTSATGSVILEAVSVIEEDSGRNFLHFYSSEGKF